MSLLAEASKLMRAGDFAGAETAIEQQLATYPGDTAALNMRAMLRHQRGDVAGAIEAMSAVIAIDTRDVARISRELAIYRFVGAVKIAGPQQRGRFLHAHG